MSYENNMNFDLLNNENNMKRHFTSSNYELISSSIVQSETPVDHLGVIVQNDSSWSRHVEKWTFQQVILLN